MQKFIQEFLVIKANAVQHIYPEEMSVLLDLNGYILYSTPCLNQLFATDLIGYAFISIEELSGYKTYINKAITNVINGDCTRGLIIFLASGAYLLEFKGIYNPQDNILQLISITLSPYAESNLLLRKLQDNKYTKSNMDVAKQKVSTVVQYLSKFQLAICYLLARNYTNSEIADIINLSKNRKQMTSRFAINKQVEKIRNDFSMPSKSALVDLIIALDMHNSLPQLLYKTPLEMNG